MSIRTGVPSNSTTPIAEQFDLTVAGKREITTTNALGLSNNVATATYVSGGTFAVNVNPEFCNWTTAIPTNGTAASGLIFVTSGNPTSMSVVNPGNFQGALPTAVTFSTFPGILSCSGTGVATLTATTATNDVLVPVYGQYVEILYVVNNGTSIFQQLAGTLDQQAVYEVRIETENPYRTFVQ